MGDAMTRVYRKGTLEAEGFAVADVSEYLDQPDTVVWVDLCTPSKKQLHALAGELGLHGPVLERWDRSPDLAAHGVPFLLYGLLDVWRRRLLRCHPGVR
jgi:hypothetical protein